MRMIVLLMALLLSMEGEAATAVDSADMTGAAVHTSSPFRLLEERTTAQVEDITLNGVALNDNKFEMMSKLGVPAAIIEDPIQRLTVYDYDYMEVGLHNERLEYVHVKPSAEQFQLNGQTVPMTIRDVHSFLGQPDHAAEDGDVYVQRSQALKVFMDRDSGLITGVDLFFTYSE